MPHYDDREAFTAMKKGAPDEVAGGAIMFESPWQTKATSEYDEEYTPARKKEFEESVMDVYKGMYASDPTVGDRDKITLKRYKANLDLDLIKERKLDYDLFSSKPGFNEFDEKNTSEWWANKFYNLADKHYGDINRLKEMAISSKDSE